ncbi:unnamed protein product [Darwinula stevensoni]|uniref:Uncharacterized protein n=1 Tax=Darwinula stevensoni TaxID=69355 RepID=A0A7R8X7J8_9CRUS|nr:unnamed protein product [Darwinula stevensoni]CAG0889185.1 unnamed protein product [Darwinula stevensoni]
MERFNLMTNEIYHRRRAPEITSGIQPRYLLSLPRYSRWRHPAEAIQRTPRGGDPEEAIQHRTQRRRSIGGHPAEDIPRAQRMRRRKQYLLGTSVLSCVAIALLGAALGTDHWVEGNATWVGENATSTMEYNVNYGLIKGTRVDGGFSSETKEIRLAVSAKENSYIWSAGESEERRLEDLNKLLATGKKGDLANFGLLVTTFVSLGLCALFLVVSAGFGVFNAFGSPIETWAGPIGLYYYNAGFALLGMIVWGVHHVTKSSKNLMLYETLTYDYVMEASLGFSYWLVFVVLALEVGNLVLVYVSQRPERERTTQNVEMDTKTAATTFIY